MKKSRYNEWSDKYPNFKPDYTPAEMFREGIFGGNYFKPDLPYQWQSHVPQEFIDEFTPAEIKHLLTSPEYVVQINRWRTTCGSSYGEWKSNGWLREQDPYGWVNWYINFYYGRRSEDDDRQIGRWSSFKGRHTGTLKRSAKPDEIRKGHKTRQNLLHWAVNSQKVE